MCSRDDSQTEGDVRPVDRSAPELSQNGEHSLTRQAVNLAFPGSGESFMDQSRAFCPAVNWVSSLEKLPVRLRKE